MSRILDRVSNGGEPVVISKWHKPLAVVVGLDRYRQVSGAHKHLAKVKGGRILKIRGIARGVADIDEAISALRRQAKKAKKSVGALIREAVKEKYLTPTPKERKEALRRLLSRECQIDFPPWKQLKKELEESMGRGLAADW